MDEFRSVDAGMLAAIVALSARVLHDALTRSGREQEMTRLRDKSHKQDSDIQAISLRQVIADTKIAAHEQQFARIEHWMEALDEKMDRLVDRRE